jgi:hypothetical protein
MNPRLRNEMKQNKKELICAVSVSLSKPEAICFARSLDTNEKWYLVKI